MGSGVGVLIEAWKVAADMILFMATTIQLSYNRLPKLWTSVSSLRLRDPFSLIRLISKVRFEFAVLFR